MQPGRAYARIISTGQEGGLCQNLNEITLRKVTSMSLTPKERLYSALKLKPVDRIPVLQPLQTGTVELMESSGVFWPEAHRDADKMARLSYEAHRVVGFEGVRVPFDVNVESEALGCILDYDKGRHKGLDIQPLVRDFPIAAKEDIAKIQIPDPAKTGRMPVVVEAVKLLCARVGPDIPVLAAIVGPFMVAGQIRGVDNLMRDLARDPGFSHELLEKCCQSCSKYAHALVEAGADVIVIIDATASPDLVSPKFYQEYAKTYAKRIADEVSVPTILHICGNASAILPYMAEVADGITFDALVDMAYAKEAVNGKAALCGNVDVNSTLLFGPIDKIEENVRYCIDNGTNLLTTACGIPPRTPTENLIAMVKAGKTYGVRK